MKERERERFYYIIYFLLILGVGTKIDPELCRADRMVGHTLGAVGSLPDIYSEIEISSFLLRRLLGVRTEGSKGAKVSFAKNFLFYIIKLFINQFFFFK